LFVLYIEISSINGSITSKQYSFKAFMVFTVKEIAKFLKARVQGDDTLQVQSVAKIEEGEAGSICFLANPAYEKFLYTTQATAIIVSESLVLQHPPKPTLLFVKDPYASFAALLEKFTPTLRKEGVEEPVYMHSTAVVGEAIYIGAFSYIGPGTQIGKGVQIYPHCYIGDQVIIDENTVLYSGVKVYPGCMIGKNCIIHAGAIIGSDGFGFASESNGTYRKIPQLGNVIVEDDVEIGANTTIDRATMGHTRIKKGAKLDNLVQIAHNVEVGSDTVMAALSGVAGSTKIGPRCMFGGQVGVAGHLTIGEETLVAGQAGIIKSYPKGHTTLMGMPAIERKTYLKNYAIFKQLASRQKRGLHDI
jgi:UDP-3-O-[3-hydroxymyristoyl] glucosamine N-acyltransferase